jgi:DNA replication initiation complex subunit (GINS family)
MIDGIKIYDLKTDPNQLLQNSYLTEYWNTTVHNADGTYKYGLAKYFGLKFQLKYDKVRLQGSLHTYRNEGRHNYDDFTSVNVEEVIKELSERFEIDTTQTELNNVEFGVNIVLPFGVSVVLNNLIVYKGEPFIRVVEEGMNYYQCKKSHFIIKIYDKGKQYKLPDNVLRFEIKVMRMQYLKTKGVPIRYLSDLLNKRIYEPLGNILTEVFESILFGDDTLNEKVLSNKEKEVYLRGSNPKAWQEKGGQNVSRKLQRLESSFNELLERHRTGVNFRKVVSELIRKKSLEMSTFYQEIENVLRLENVHFLPTDRQEQKDQNIHFLHFSYSVNPVYEQTTSTDKNVRPKTKLCSGCGKPIEDDRLYHSLDCKERRDERNARSNDRNNFKRRFNKLVSKPSLFNVVEIVRLSEQQKQWVSKN